MLLLRRLRAICTADDSGRRVNFVDSAGRLKTVDFEELTGCGHLEQNCFEHEHHAPMHPKGRIVADQEHTVTVPMARVVVGRMNRVENDGQNAQARRPRGENILAREPAS